MPPLCGKGGGQKGDVHYADIGHAYYAYKVGREGHVSITCGHR